MVVAKPNSLNLIPGTQLKGKPIKGERRAGNSTIVSSDLHVSHIHTKSIRQEVSLESPEAQTSQDPKVRDRERAN